MHRAIGDMASLVLHAKAEDLLFDRRRGDELTSAEQGQDDAFTEQVHQRRAFVVALGVEDQLEEVLDDGLGLADAAAVGQSALAEDLGVTGLVHHLGAEKHLRLDEVVVDPPQPLRREVGGDHLDLGQHRAQLAHRVFDVGVQLGQFGPGDVARGAPLAAHTLFVEIEEVVGPHLVLGVDRVAHVGYVGVDVGTARCHGATGRRLGNFAVATDGDIAHRQPDLARLRLDPPFGLGVA